MTKQNSPLPPGDSDSLLPAEKIRARPAFEVPQLNPRQLEAARYLGGHLLVFAGAGSGKTRVLTSRIAFLIGEKRARPHEILAVTFTNKAAREMRGRVEALLPEKVSGIWMGTFHSICSRILRAEITKLPLGYRSNFAIYDASDQKSVIKKCLAEMDLNEESFPPEMIRGIIERLKRDGNFPPTEGDFSPNEKNLRAKLEVIARCDAAMKRANALDFNDLLMLAVRLFQTDSHTLRKYQNRFRHILVDEYQDTNRVQYEFVKILSAGGANVCAVGDDSQSIYGWRGAQVRNILDFAKDFPGAKTVRLEKNYRSTRAILDASNSLISRNRIRSEKRMWTDGAEGSPISVYEARNEFDEADFVVSKIKSLVDSGDFSPSDFAVLYRTNSKSRLFEQRFSAEDGLLCRVVGAISFYARAEVKDALCYLRALANPSDDAAVLRIINVPPRGIGNATVEKLSAFASSERMSILGAARAAERGDFLKKRAASAVSKFARMMDGLADFARGRGALEVVTRVLERTGYGDFVERDENRRDNILEFVNSAAEFDEISGGTESVGIESFIERASLAGDEDSGAGDDAVKLMTLHSSKGLEFPVVFIAGMNADVLPLSRSGEVEDIEEERRLCYVGMTRAMSRLFLCYPLEVSRYGSKRPATASEFFDEIPDNLKVYEDFLSDAAFTRADDFSPVADLNSVSPAKLRNSSGNFIAGSFVRHQKFGRGKVVKIEGSGEKSAVTVFFRSAGTKRILASFLKPV